MRESNLFDHIQITLPPRYLSVKNMVSGYVGSFVVAVIYTGGRYLKSRCNTTLASGSSGGGADHSYACLRMSFPTMGGIRVQLRVITVLVYRVQDSRVSSDRTEYNCTLGFELRIPSVFQNDAGGKIPSC